MKTTVRLSRLLSLIVCLALMLSLLPIPTFVVHAAGSISLTTLDTAYTENFDTLANTGTSSIVPNGWAFLETGTNANTAYTAGTGSSTTGDTYSFGASASTERAFGGLLSGSLNPTIGASFTNDTGSAITSLAISYTGEEWRLGATGRADRIDFQYSTNASSLNTGIWTDFDALDFSTPDTSSGIGAKNGNSASERTPLSATITGLNITSGGTFWIRWLDFNPAGSDDGLAVDDFSLTPSSTEQPPSVANSVPANGATNVLLNSNVTVTFSEPVDVTSSFFTLSCDTSGAHTATVTGGPTIFTINPDVDFVGGESCTLTVLADQVSDQDNIDPPDHMVTDFTAGFTTLVLVPIHDIQGAGHLSPVNSQTVATEGIVTAKRSNGFYMETPNSGWDGDPATSEGIFVFTSSAPNVQVGDDAVVSGKVSEFRSGGANSTNLTTTELTSPSTTVTSSGNTLPDPVVIGAGDRQPPTSIIENDATGSVETSGVFDPAEDGIDFYESLESMYVQVNNAQAVGPWHNFGSNREIPVVGDNGANVAPGLLTPRGGIIIQPGNFNPERIVLNDLISGGPTLPSVNVGDKFPGATLGVMDYSFGNFKLEVTFLPPLVSGNLAQETTADASDNQLSVATFNVENLAPTDPQSKFDTLAGLIVNNLRSPDLIAIEEIQDNNGVTDNGTVDASTTWGLLISAIQAAGGPAYAYRQIDPVNDQDGGAPGGNIRQGFLFRSDRGLSFVDRPGAGSTDANSVVNNSGVPQLQFSPGRIDPNNAAFSDSRKPLAGEFLFKGRHIFAIANHFNSKSGDQPLFGVFQPPQFSSETQRLAQATVEHDFVNNILAVDPNANVIVLGDLNDFQFSNPVKTLEGSPAILTDLIDTLPANQRYSYVFDGNSETLDHTLFSGGLTTYRPFVYQVVHVNSEFAVQASDHEPQAAKVAFNPSAVNTPTVVPEPSVEGQAVVASATADLIPGDAPYTCAVNYGDGSSPVAGTVTTSSSGMLCTGPSHTYSTFGTYTVTVSVTNQFSETGSNSVLHTVIFLFTGFFSPVDNPPVLNSVKSGSAIPFKFSLNGDKGLGIIASGSPTSQTIVCSSSASVDPIEETVSPGSSTLSYDPTTGQYTYVWKTDKSWSGTCRQFTLKLVDGTVHQALFEFTK